MEHKLFFRGERERGLVDFQKAQLESGQSLNAKTEAGYISQNIAQFL